MKPVVAVTEPLAQPALEWLAGHARVLAVSPDLADLQDPQAVSGAVVRTLTRVDAAWLDRLPALRVIGRAGVGLDNIELPACHARGVRVVHTPDANTQAVVEYVLCLLCDAIRPRLFLDKPVDATRWEAIRSEVHGLRQMDELTLGILGLGRIGSRVAQVAAAIGFRVIFNDLRAITSDHRHGAEAVDVETLFRTADVITLHIDGRPSNRGCVHAGLIGSMRPDALLINTCRGFVLDHAALAQFLRARPGSQALLDVHEPEPFTASNPLLGLPNAHLAPHLASRTRTAMDRMSWVVRDVMAVLEGREPDFPA
jgi:phosphoglycerate dehydrogenase-like enzyme